MINIKEVYASAFGKLKDMKIELNEGINVIYGHNEAGKTTLINLINALLFGMCSNETKNKTYLPQYYKYIPWDAMSYGGHITFQANGHEIRLRRELLKEKEEVQVFDLTSSKDITESMPYNKTTRQKDAAKHFFSLNKELFENTVFLTQGSLKFSGNTAKNVRECIASATTSLSANMSYISAMGILRKQSDEIGTVGRKASRLGKAAERVKRLSAELEEAKRSEEEKQEKEKNISEAHARLEHIDTKLHMVDELIQKCMRQSDGKFSKEDARQIVKDYAKYKDATPARTSETKEA